MLNLNYFYEDNCENFAFYQIPKLLFTHKKYKTLSVNAKVLYGLMLDRISLSRKNNWIDEEGRVYIYYTIEDIMADLGCSRQTAVNTIDELDFKKGIGLIEKKRQGLGKPSIIYVKDFSSIIKTTDEQEKSNSVNGNEVNICEKSSNSAEVQNLDFKKSSSEDSRSLKFRLQESQNLDFKKSVNNTSRSEDFRLQESQNLDSNNTHMSNTNMSNTNLSIYPSDIKDGLMDYSSTYEMVKENISYDALIIDHKHDTEIIDGMLNIITDVLCMDSDYMVIGKAKYPISVVKSRFSKLNMSHIEYCLTTLKNNVTKIQNIKAYLLTTLYNCIDTIGLYYQNDYMSSFNSENG